MGEHTKKKVTEQISKSANSKYEAAITKLVVELWCRTIKRLICKNRKIVRPHDYENYVYVAVDEVEARSLSRH